MKKEIPTVAPEEQKDILPMAENYLGKALHDFFTGIASFSIFTFRFFKEVFRPPYEFNEFFKQCFLIGNKSLPLVGITGFIMGLVFTHTVEADACTVWGAELVAGYGGSGHGS